MMSEADVMLADLVFTSEYQVVMSLFVGTFYTVNVGTKYLTNYRFQICSDKL